jgi:hypothetical protein
MLVYQRVMDNNGIFPSLHPSTRRFFSIMIVGISEYLINIFPSTNWNHHGKLEMTMESWDKTYVFFLSSE